MSEEKKGVRALNHSIRVLETGRSGFIMEMKRGASGSIKSKAGQKQEPCQRSSVNQDSGDMLHFRDGILVSDRSKHAFRVEVSKL